MKLTNEKWRKILDHKDAHRGSLAARIIDTVLENSTLIKYQTDYGRCPQFSLTIKNLNKCMDDLINLVDDK